MIWTLKKENIPIMSLDILFTPHGFRVMRIIKVYDRVNAPMPLRRVRLNAMPHAFTMWYMNRIIPKDREDLNKTANCLCNSIADTDDYYGVIILISFLAYGRNFSDTFWMAPAKNYKMANDSANPYASYINVQKPWSICECPIPFHHSYAGMNFFKNGFAEDYSHRVLLKNKIEDKQTMYNAPDFCTNGHVKKRFVFDEDEMCLFLEKFYPHMPQELLQNLIIAMSEAYSKYPDLLVGTHVLMDKDDPLKLAGYRSRVFTNDNICLFTLRDLCALVDTDNWRLTFNNLKAGVAYLSLPNDAVAEMVQIAKTYFKPEFGFTKESLYDNAGFLYNNNTKEIIKPIMWF